MLGKFIISPPYNFCDQKIVVHVWHYSITSDSQAKLALHFEVCHILSIYNDIHIHVHVFVDQVGTYMYIHSKTPTFCTPTAVEKNGIHVHVCVPE